MAGGQIVAEGTPSAIGGRDTARARIPVRPACRDHGRRPARRGGGGDDGLVTVQTAGADPDAAPVHRLGAATTARSWAGQRGPAQPGGHLPAPDRPRRAGPGRWKGAPDERRHHHHRHHRARRRDLALLCHQVRYGPLSFWRNPQSAFFTFVFPVVIITSSARCSATARESLLLRPVGAAVLRAHDRRGIGAGLLYRQLAIVLALRRQNGILKRILARRCRPGLLSRPAGALRHGERGRCRAHRRRRPAVRRAAARPLGRDRSGAGARRGQFLRAGRRSGLADPQRRGRAAGRAARPVPAGIRFRYVLPDSLRGAEPVLRRVAGRPFNEALLGPFTGTPVWTWKSLGVLLAWGAVGALVAIRRFRWNPRPNDRRARAWPLTAWRAGETISSS